MKHIDFRKTLNASVLTGGTIVATSSLDQPQGGYDTGSAMMGGYSSDWSYSSDWTARDGYVEILLLAFFIAEVAGFVAWILA